MTRAGILSEKDRVELLEGWIVPKMTKNPPHDAVVSLVDAAIRLILPLGWHIRIQSAITTDTSEPEPDLAVVRGSMRRYLDHHPAPTEVALIVEVAESSLEVDRRKCRIYAQAGIASYWLVNLIDSRLEVYTHAEATGNPPKYARASSLSSADNVSLEIDGIVVGTIPVSDVLP
jgi:Uma2 family endonuclease